MPGLTGALGTTATLTYAATQTSQTIEVIFEEYVGAVDSVRRATFTVAEADLDTVPTQRVDYFVLSGETDRWTIVDVRDGKSGAVEFRADGKLTRT